MTLKRSLLCALLLFHSNFCCSSPTQDAYKILGVSSNASQDEIRRRYRKLCLKLHPDKNVHLTPKERERCEEQFKKVQDANTQIGDEEARKKYDLASSSPFGTNMDAGTGMDRSAAEAFYRSFYNIPRTARRSSRTPFYVNGIDMSELFTGNAGNRKTAFWNPTSLKAVYIQKVHVPLQDLYAGRKNTELILKDTIWKRYRAAFRGGVGVPILYQAAVLAVPLVRLLGMPFSLLPALALFHVNLPRPTKLRYDANIQPGWKSGTKLTFQDVEPGFDVVFILVEQTHGRYHRIGNDLHTSVTIRKKQAREGCTIHIEPLCPLDAPILVRLRSHHITKSGQQVTINGKGWPKKSGGRGNLVVTVNLLSRPVSRRGARRSVPTAGRCDETE